MHRIPATECFAFEDVIVKNSKTVSELLFTMVITRQTNTYTHTYTHLMRDSTGDWFKIRTYSYKKKLIRQYPVAAIACNRIRVFLYYALHLNRIFCSFYMQNVCRVRARVYVCVCVCYVSD
jgi:hypothetical protein